MLIKTIPNNIAVTTANGFISIVIAMKTQAQRSFRFKGWQLGKGISVWLEEDKFVLLQLPHSLYC